MFDPPCRYTTTGRLAPVSITGPRESGRGTTTLSQRQFSLPIQPMDLLRHCAQ